MNRLLLITTDFPPQTGGVARYLGLMASYFKDRLCVISRSDELLYRFFWPRWIKSVLLLLRQQSTYDFVISSQLLPLGTAALVASWFTKKPYIIIVHGMDVRLALTTRVKRILSTFVLNHARIVVANSKALSREVGEAFHLALPLVVYPCVESLSTVSLKSTVQESMKPFVFLTVSRLISRKGHVDVLNALAYLKQIGDLPPFEYHIVGQGPMEPSLKEVTTQLQLSEVTFYGAVSDEEREKQYALADVFVMPVTDDPVDKEGFGTVFLEAARFAVPSVSTTIQGVDEAILHGQTGLLVSPHDHSALAQALLTLMTSAQERTRLGNNARERVNLEFTCEKQFAKLESYI